MSLILPMVPRPKTRGDCKNGIRPCPWVSCRFHLYLDVTAHGRLSMNFPDKEPHELEWSCSLDIADMGEHSTKKLAGMIGVKSKQAIEQAEWRALGKLARPALSKIFRETKER